MAQPLKLDPSRRMFLLGRTDSGKTFLAKHLLRQMARRHWRIVIVDPKAFWLGEDPEWERKGPGTVDKPRLVTAFDPRLAVQCFQPSIPAWQDPAFDQLCADVLEAGNTIFYCDEADGVCTAQASSPSFTRLWTQGRARRVGAWSGSQRPYRLLDVMKSQCEVWMIFQLQGLRNRQEAAEYTDTPEIINTKLPRHWFWLWDIGMDRAELMRPIVVKGHHA